MARALELAWRGWGRVAPNPMVGALVLSPAGEPLAEAWHAEFGRAHAERAALDTAGAGTRGATVVVTLEPCAHQGKQPPCTEAIIAAGVRRVVAAAPDPNPEARGGAEFLRGHGVEVDLGLLERDVRCQNAAFFHAFRGLERPWVVLKLATSLDHRIADPEGRSRWLSGLEAREYAHWLRAGFDGLVIGGRTALADDPNLTVRGPVTPRLPPRRVVLAGRDPLPESLRLISTAHLVPTTIVIRRGAEISDRWRLEAHGVQVLVAEGLADALRQLWRDGVGSLLVEGGGRLAGALLAAGLVDRFCWIQSPIWVGSGGVPATAGWDVENLDAAERWSVVERKPLGEDTLLVLDRVPCSPAS